MSINTRALFPVMFLLPRLVFKGFDIPFSIKDFYIRSGAFLFGPTKQFIGAINIIHRYDGSLTSNQHKKDRREIRFWTFYVFRNLNRKVGSNSNHFTGNVNEYAIVNINGQPINQGDMFSRVVTTYLELNQLTQKYKMTCFYKKITTIINGTPATYSVLFMTPIPYESLSPLHHQVIDMLQLQYVYVQKNRDHTNKQPEYAFVVRRVPHPKGRLRSTHY
jgi:hypothetical protein